MKQAKAWLDASRPKTLTASLSPVLLGTSLAYHDGTFRSVPAVLCLLVAVFAQIASNFANDYFDYRKGADRSDRLGPERAVACGWIQPEAMFRATLLMLLLTCVSGSFLVLYAGWQLIWVGGTIVVFALAYTAGPFPLAYNGLGDICVLVFFGIVPVCFTYYVQALSFTPLVFCLSLALGFLSVNILVINNYRDYEQDKTSGKRTTVVLFGKKFAKIFYMLNIVAAVCCTLPLAWNISGFGSLFLICLLPLFVKTWLEMKRNTGVLLNSTLARTAQNVLIYALAVSFVLIVFS